MTDPRDHESAFAALEFGEQLLARERQQAQAAASEQRVALRQRDDAALAREKDVSRAFTRIRADVAERDKSLVEARGQIEMLEARLAAIEGSTTWQIARRLRAVVSRHRLLEMVLKRTLGTLVRIARLKLRVQPDAAGAGVAASASETLPPESALDAGNTVDRQCSRTETATGWFGGTAVLINGPYRPQEFEARADQQHGVVIGAGYGRTDEAVQVTQLRAIAPKEVIASILRSREPRAAARRISDPAPACAILTVIAETSRSYHRTVASVQAVVEQAGRPVEWIVVDLRKSTDAAGLLVALPEGLAKVTRVLEKPGADEPSGLNEARRATSADWLLLLGCGDELEACAMSALDARTRSFPDCRFLSSCHEELFEGGAISSWHANGDTTGVFEDERVIGALTMVRADLFDELGGFRSGYVDAHQYDFALRAALHEPLLSIPDFLYRRWLPEIAPTHPAGSLGIVNALRDCLRRVAEISDGVAMPARVKSAPAERRQLSSGLCIVRTTGERLDFLAEAVASVREQGLPVSVCVVVHGHQDAVPAVKRHLAEQNLDARVIGATEGGHPFNAGLDYLQAHSEEHDFCFFLEDRNVVHPFFTRRLVDLLTSNDCDVAVAEMAFRPLGQAPRRDRRLLPLCALVNSDFVALQGCIMRTSTLVRNGWRFDEKLDCLDGWQFVLSAFAGGANFALLPEVLCEMRVDDAAAMEEQSPIRHAFARACFLERARQIASALGPRRFIGHIAEFDFFARPSLTRHELEELREARAMYFAAEGR